MYCTWTPIPINMATYAIAGCIRLHHQHAIYHFLSCILFSAIWNHFCQCCHHCPCYLPGLPVITIERQFNHMHLLQNSVYKVDHTDDVIFRCYRAYLMLTLRWGYWVSRGENLMWGWSHSYNVSAMTKNKRKTHIFSLAFMHYSSWKEQWLHVWICSA